MTVLAVDGVVRRHAWGSRTAVQRLFGLPEDGRPIAEVWFGAHPDDPSPVIGRDAALDAVLAGEPELLGGQRRLPFLAKILAADTALSMQVHPDLAQARAGFAAEDALGVPRTARERNYRDANHKPELLCALTPFDALCGFAPVERTLAELDALAAPELSFVADLLRGPDPLRAAFTALLTHEEPAALAAAVTTRADRLGAHRYAVGCIAADFPGDVGAVLALLLNPVRLEPGEAIFLGAGNVHCYLRGAGVEVMAESDNVLRCALTPKHVDVAELLRITDFRELTEPRWPGRGGAFEVPVPDFRLCEVDAAAGTLVRGGPAIVLGVDAPISVGDVEVAPGQAVFVAAGTPALELRGAGRAFVVTGASST